MFILTPQPLLPVEVHAPPSLPVPHAPPYVEGEVERGAEVEEDVPLQLQPVRD